MKILQINAVYGLGSTGNMARDIAAQLVEQGHQGYVMWATACRNDRSDIELLRIGSWWDHKCHALWYRLFGGQGMYSKAATKRACKNILRISPDVVHLHNLHSNYIHLPTLFSFLAEHKIPTLITLHDCWFVAGGCMHYINYACDQWKTGCLNCPAFPKRLKKSVVRSFDVRKELYANMSCLAVNGVSGWTTEVARQSILHTAKHIECIYNWIDTERFAPQASSDAVRERYGIAKERKLILGVAQRWSQKKGSGAFVALADAMADVADIVLVGDRGDVPERNNLHCIGFTSSVDELVALYSAADVFVNPSAAETFGLVTAEAMACGTPVVAYRNSGTAEIVAEDCGRLVADSDVAALIDAVKSILDVGKKVYTVACRRHVCEHFDKNKQIQKYIELYGKLSVTDSLNWNEGY